MIATQRTDSGDDYDDTMEGDADDYMADDSMEDYEYDQTVEGDEDVS